MAESHLDASFWSRHGWKRSQKLLDRIHKDPEFSRQDGICLHEEVCDLVIGDGVGYFDEAVGPYLFDLATGYVSSGVDLALRARDYDPKAVIFFAYDEYKGQEGLIAYYQYGKDEDDAMRRFDEALSNQDLAMWRQGM